MIKNSIVRRLTSWYAASFILIFTFGSASLYISLDQILVSEKSGILQDHYESLVNIIHTYANVKVALQSRIDEWSRRDAVRVFSKVLDAHGKVIAQTSALPLEIGSDIFPKDKVFEVSSGKPNGRIVRASGGDDYITFAKKAVMPQEGEVTLFMALDLSSDQEVLARYKHSFFLILGVMFFASLMIGARLAKLSFRPVQDIIDITKRISSSRLDERIDEKKLPRELFDMGLTINEMLDRMGDSFHRLERFSADIAHEMRTPLNNMRGEIEVSLQQNRSSPEYREVVYSVLEEIQRLSQMIDALLFLAKADSANLEMKLERFNVKAELANIIDLYEASIVEENLTIDTQIDPEIFLSGEPTLFQRAVANLISNAISNTPRKGQVSVRVFRAGEKVNLTVEDTGRGIAPADLVKVFDRFYRVDPSRTTTKYVGFGLGLTIVKSIMTLFGGEVSLESELNRGTKVTLTFLQ